MSSPDPNLKIHDKDQWLKQGTNTPAEDREEERESQE
jgi:hypothetical protein